MYQRDRTGERAWRYRPISIDLAREGGSPLLDAAGEEAEDKRLPHGCCDGCSGDPTPPSHLMFRPYTNPLLVTVGVAGRVHGRPLGGPRPRRWAGHKPASRALSAAAVRSGT